MSSPIKLTLEAIKGNDQVYIASSLYTGDTNWTTDKNEHGEMCVKTFMIKLQILYTVR